MKDPQEEFDNFITSYNDMESDESENKVNRLDNHIIDSEGDFFKNAIIKLNAMQGILDQHLEDIRLRILQITGSEDK